MIIKETIEESWKYYWSKELVLELYEKRNSVFCSSCTWKLRFHWNDIRVKWREKAMSCDVESPEEQREWIPMKL